MTEHIRTCVTCEWEGDAAQTIDHDGGGRCPRCESETIDADA